MLMTADTVGGVGPSRWTWPEDWRARESKCCWRPWESAQAEQRGTGGDDSKPHSDVAATSSNGWTIPGRTSRRADGGCWSWSGSSAPMWSISTATGTVSAVAESGGAHGALLRASWWDAVRGGRAAAGMESISRAGKGLVARPVCCTRLRVRCCGRWKRTTAAKLPPRYAIPNGRERSRYRPAREGSVRAELPGGCGMRERTWPHWRESRDRLPGRSYLAGGTQSPDGDVRRFPACRMLGPLAADELADWYGRAAIYALPARYEPFGLSALEAALSGCALVLSDIPSLREIWEDAAFFVSPNDEAHAVQRRCTGLIARSGPPRNCGSPLQRARVPLLRWSGWCKGMPMHTAR